MRGLEDHILLKRLLKREPDALEYIMERYQKLLWVIIEGILGKVGAAEDIEECLSDVFIRLWNKPNAFNPKKGSLKVFVCVMARSAALNKYKALAKTTSVELDDETVLPKDGDLFDFIYGKNLSRDIYSEICKMKEPDKEILIRRFFLDEKPSQIAGKILLSAKEVENRIYQGRIRLKNIFKEVEV